MRFWKRNRTLRKVIVALIALEPGANMDDVGALLSELEGCMKRWPLWLRVSGQRDYALHALLDIGMRWGSGMISSSILTFVVSRAIITYRLSTEEAFRYVDRYLQDTASAEGWAVYTMSSCSTCKTSKIACTKGFFDMYYRMHQRAHCYARSAVSITSIAPSVGEEMATCVLCKQYGLSLLTSLEKEVFYSILKPILMEEMLTELEHMF